MKFVNTVFIKKYISLIQVYLMSLYYLSVMSIKTLKENKHFLQHSHHDELDYNLCSRDYVCFVVRIKPVNLRAFP